ncbi:MAG: HAD family hydrolase [Bacillota bacterium]|nr:HAD-IA family hydrolase [Clostridia bacterium]
MYINTILFDLDGTIADTLPLIKKTYARVFEEMNIPWGNDDVMKMIGLPLRDIGRIMAGMGKEDEFFNNYQKQYRLLHHNYIKAFPGIKDMLHQLNDMDFSLGIVTSKSKTGADLTLSSVNLDKFFSIIVTVDDTDKHKPNPEPVLYAMKKLGKTPQESAYVGDSPFDIESGNRAGVTTIAVGWGMAPIDKLLEHSPTYSVNTVKELTKLLLSLAGY